jgi:glutaminyl-peptide cyclotransferase
LTGIVRRIVLPAAVCVVAVLAACGTSEAASKAAAKTTTKPAKPKAKRAVTTKKPSTTKPTATKPSTTIAAAAVNRATVKVIRTIPKDATGFTQGLEVRDGKLYESVGLYGQSEMRIVDLTTGAVTKKVRLDSSLFAEGATFLPDGSLVQLTWREKVAIVRDPVTLQETKRFTYQQEGWGICYSSSADQLVHSDGSGTLFLRDASTFAEEQQRTVIDPRRKAVENLNELECSGSSVFANVWTEDRILEIDLRSGAVLTEIDASSLSAQIPNRTPDQVLNGIASLGNSRYLVTGKQWPLYFEVEFVVAP